MGTESRSVGEQKSAVPESTQGQVSVAAGAKGKKRWDTVGSRLKADGRNEAFFAITAARGADGRPGDVVVAAKGDPSSFGSIQASAAAVADDLLQADDEIGQHPKGKSPRRKRDMDSSQAAAAASMQQPNADSGKD